MDAALSLVDAMSCLWERLMQAPGPWEPFWGEQWGEPVACDCCHRPEREGWYQAEERRWLCLTCARFDPDPDLRQVWRRPQRVSVSEEE